MKKALTIILTVALVALAGTAMAADTATLTVSAQVVGTCQFNSGGALAFVLDPAVGGDVTQAAGTQPEFWCTANAAWAIGNDNGVNAANAACGTPPCMVANVGGTDYAIPFTLSYTAAGTGAGVTSPITMDISGTVLGADYINQPASAAYADTITLSINP
jgi:spore coat protein U-like protein